MCNLCGNEYSNTAIPLAIKETVFNSERVTYGPVDCFVGKQKTFEYVLPIALNLICCPEHFLFLSIIVPLGRKYCQVASCVASLMSTLVTNGYRRPEFLITKVHLVDTLQHCQSESIMATENEIPYGRMSVKCGV